jgi:hypothetical protein
MVRKLTLFVFLATAALCAQGPPISGAPNRGTVTASPQNEIAVFSASGTSKTVAGDSNLDDGKTTANTLTYAGPGGIASNGGFKSSGASGAGQVQLGPGTEVTPPAGVVTQMGPVTLTTAYGILYPGAPAADTNNRMLTATLDGSGNEIVSFGAPTPVGCTSGCNYVLTTSDQATGPGSAGSAISTANQGQYVEFFNNAYRKISNACVQVTTLDSGGHFDVGVYSISGTTGTLQWHTGSQSTTSTGAICVTPTAYTMLPGANYYVAWCADNTTSVIEALTGEAVIAAAGPAHTAGVDATDTCSTGVLPATITTTNIANTSTHLVVPYVYVNN